MRMKDLEQMSKCSKCFYYCKSFATFVFSHIGLISLVAGYTIIGAFTFEALEADFEFEEKVKRRVARNEVVHHIWDFTYEQIVLHKGNWTPVINEQLKDFEKSLVFAVRRMGYDGNDETDLQWTFSGALLYSIIVITTIGYGNVAPKTQLGKVVTILYAVVGIPLMLFCMSNIGDTLAHSFKFVYWKVCCYFCVRAKKAERARNARYRRYPSMRSRPGSIRYSSHRSSHRSSRHSGGSYRYDIDDLGSVDEVCCKYVDDEVDSYIQQRRRHHAINTQPRTTHYDSGPPAPPPLPALPEGPPTNKVPIIFNKYALESKEDLHVDLPLSATTKDSNNLQARSSSSHASTPTNSAPAPRPPRRCASMEPMRHYSSRRKHFTSSTRSRGPTQSIDDFDFDFFDIDSDPGYDELDKEHVTVPIWLCCALVTGYICGGAVLFSIWEGWEFLNSSYFCFVTLTTIGFGDLVPGKSVIREDSQAALAICSLYLLFGMALLAMSFNLVQEQVSTSMKSIGKMMGIVEDDEEIEDIDDN